MTDMPGIAAAIIAGFAAGLALGLVYFLVLWRSVRQLTQGGSGLGFVAGLLLRLAVLLGGLGLLIRTGAGPLSILAAGLGFVLARLVATRILNRPAERD